MITFIIGIAVSIFGFWLVNWLILVVVDVVCPYPFEKAVKKKNNEKHIFEKEITDSDYISSYAWDLMIMEIISLGIFTIIGIIINHSLGSISGILALSPFIIPTIIVYAIKKDNKKKNRIFLEKQESHISYYINNYGFNSPKEAVVYFNNLDDFEEERKKTYDNYDNNNTDRISFEELLEYRYKTYVLILFMNFIKEKAPKIQMFDLEQLFDETNNFNRFFIKDENIQGYPTIEQVDFDYYFKSVLQVLNQLVEEKKIMVVANHNTKNAVYQSLVPIEENSDMEMNLVEGECLEID